MSAALRAFQPGDRVLVEMDYLGLDTLSGSYGRVGSVSGGSSFPALMSGIRPLPTPAAQLRAAAEIMAASGDWAEGPINALRADADRLEATSAPKPVPTLREAAQEMAVCVRRCIVGRMEPAPDGATAHALATLDEALAREGAAK